MVQALRQREFLEHLRATSGHPAGSASSIRGHEGPPGSGSDGDHSRPRQGDERLVAVYAIRLGTLRRSMSNGPCATGLEDSGPTMLVNIIGGIQGSIDHALVGHWSFQGNAAIGGWKSHIVTSHPAVTGMRCSSSASRCGEEDKVNDGRPGVLTAIGIRF